MHPILQHSILGQHFQLTPGKCLFWEERKSLILSDLHLGKTGHFRKSGIAMPQTIFMEDMQRLVSLLQSFKPESMIIIGDMFHSRDNREHELFLKWRKDFSWLPIQLVKGNHDILDSGWYRHAAIDLHEAFLQEGPFLFTHDIAEEGQPAHEYSFSGHIHPGITIKGIGRQALRFPCFYFGKKGAVLPAFGRFTGTHGIEPKRGESVYAIIENRLLKVK